MRSFLFGVALVVLGLPSWAPAQSTPGKKYALLVGINEYQHANLRPLLYPENDVTELAAVLGGAGFDVSLLSNTRGKDDARSLPTLANIDAHLQAILGKCRRGDLVLVALAGHGLQFEGINDSYFCPEDAAPFKDEHSRKTLLSLRTVFAQMERCPGAKLLLVDACRNDPSRARGRGIDGANAPRPPSGTAALFSCSPGELAFEHDNYRHGIFFHHVLEGLRGKARNEEGMVEWDALSSYVRRRVPAEVQRLIGGGARQTPVLIAGELAGAPPVLIGESQGASARAYLGCSWTTLSQAYAERWKLPLAGQPQISVVIPGGGADRMGLRAGDVVERVNGREVVSSAQAFAAIRSLRKGEHVAIVAFREGQRLTLTGPYETAFSHVEEARRLRELAEDNPAAQNMLASYYQGGIGVAKDNAEAVRWYRKGAEQGYAPSQYNLGVMYLQGLGGLIKDEKEAVRWYRKAADQGYAPAQNSLGWRHQQGLGGLAKDEAEAVRWYRKAAEQGYALSQGSLGILYSTGRGGLPKDETEAVRWYRMAAEQGLANGQYNLGAMYAKGGGGLTRDDTEAVRWYRKAAEQGNAWAQFQMGVMCAAGRGGLAKDETEAVRWYRKAAELGYAPAQSNLGWRYQQGVGGLSKDDVEAVRWYRNAAEQGYAEAQNTLGAMYSSGRGVARDDSEAVRLFHKAAEQGHAGGQCNLGLMYANGSGLTKDPTEAVGWYRKAADQGNARAQYYLGTMYARGRGIARDDAEAARWYRLAAAQGIADATAALQRVAKAQP